MYCLILRTTSERDYLEHLVVDGRIILKWIFNNYYLKAWTVMMWLRIETGGRLL